MSFISGEHQIFYINSHERLSGTDSDFTYQLKINRNVEFNRVAVLQCIIPKSYYLVQEGQNTFTLTENGVDTKITVLAGNYNRKSMQRTLETLLNDASPNGWTYTITYPNASMEPDTGKFTFNVSGNGGVQPIFTFTEFLYEQIGFNANSSNTFVSDHLTSTNTIKLQKEDSLYVCSDICTVADGKNAVLQEVFANADSETFSNIKFTCPDVQAYSKKFNSGSDIYRFTLTDENFRPINLNGLNIVISLVLYKNQDSWMKIITDYIKLRAHQNKK